MSLFIKIDGNGEVYDFSDQPVHDFEQAQAFLGSLKIDSNHTFRGEFQGQHVIVEPYSFPFIAKKINQVSGHILSVDCVYDLVLDLDLKRIFLDYNDRFIIYTTTGLPVILNAEAQDQLFNLADSFTDETIEIAGTQYPTPLWMNENADLSESYLWSERYIKEDTGWDMGSPSPSLVWAVDKLKLPRMRVAVLGCGAGHDAQLFASKGHMVTGFDFSQEAIKKAQSLYPSHSHLKWECRDVFEISDEFRNSFDLIVEHTCFCAVDPARRSELVKVWRSILSDEGQILGVFFVMPKPYGPPYGGTEEEIQDLLQEHFRKSLWVRSKVSHPGRLGRELVVVAHVKRG